MPPLHCLGIGARTSSNLQEGAQPVQHQIGALLDDPVPDAVDQLDFEIAYVLRISAQQIRCEHRILGATQPADRDLDGNVVEFAAQPASISVL
jgi:hypothetical protein